MSNRRAAKRKQLSPTPCWFFIMNDDIERDNHGHNTSLVLHTSFGQPGASRTTIIPSVFPSSLSLPPQPWVKVKSRKTLKDLSTRWHIMFSQPLRLSDTTCFHFLLLLQALFQEVTSFLMMISVMLPTRVLSQDCSKK